MSWFGTLFGGRPHADETPKGATASGVGDVGQLVDRLMVLVSVANRWGKENGYPLFEKYPQYKEVREIGEKLSDMGGIELMREAQRIANERIPCPGMTEFWWHRIGDWLA